MCDSSPMKGSVAVIGAGPGGLVAARWLLAQGFEPTIFEQAPTLGGQWCGLAGLSCSDFSTSAKPVDALPQRK